MSVPAEWLELEPEEPRAASKLQRQCLYKLGYQRPLVKSLTVEEADKLIKIALTAKTAGAGVERKYK